MNKIKFKVGSTYTISIKGLVGDHPTHVIKRAIFSSSDVSIRFKKTNDIELTAKIPSIGKLTIDTEVAGIPISRTFDVEVVE